MKKKANHLVVGSVVIEGDKPWVPPRIPFHVDRIESLEGHANKYIVYYYGWIYKAVEE